MKNKIYTVLAFWFLSLFTANGYADNGSGLYSPPPGQNPNEFDFGITGYGGSGGPNILDGGIGVTSTPYTCGDGTSIPIYTLDWKTKVYSGLTRTVFFKVNVSGTGCNGEPYTGAINGSAAVPAGHPWADNDGDGVPNYRETDAGSAPDTQQGTDECPLVKEDGSHRNQPKANVGNPINIINGNKIQAATDISFNSPFEGGFTFRRFYNHQSTADSAMGFRWTHNYNIEFSKPLSPFTATSDPTQSSEGPAPETKETVRIADATGRAVYFEDQGEGEGYKGRLNEQSRLTKDSDVYVWHRLDGNRYSFGLVRGERTVRIRVREIKTGRVSYKYSIRGVSLWRLKTISDPKGNEQHLTYDRIGRLSTVLDKASERSITFHYTDSRYYYKETEKISHITGPVTQAVPDGIWARYAYNNFLKTLASVTYADNSGFRYEYHDGLSTGPLSRLTDLQGHFISGWEYEGNRAVKSITADDRGVTLEYEEYGRKVHVTDVYGNRKTYTIETSERGRPVITSIEGASDCSSCGDDVSLISYDPLQRVVKKVYANGRTDTFEYDAEETRNNPKRETTAVGTELERTVTYTWHPRFSKELSRTETSLLGEGEKVTIWDYDDDGNTVPNENPTSHVSRLIERGFTHDVNGTKIPYEYITTYRYNGKGQVTEVDGPLTGDTDRITFTYDTESGDLLSATLTETGTVTCTHDAAGNVLSTTDANGKTTVFTYDGKNRITGTVTDDTTTRINYTPSGKVGSVTDPEGRTVSYTYEEQFNRLKRIADPLGNFIQYGYDAYGNRAETSLHSADGARHNLSRRSYDGGDHPGKLWKVIDPDNSETVFSYDDSGNRTSVLDAENNRTYYTHDILNRVIEVIRPGETVTAYGYDVQGNLASVTDPNGNRTIYEFDDLGRNVTRVSPETGTTRYAYDAAGHLVKERRNDGSITQYTYDGLGRLTGKTYADHTENVTYTWDQGTNGKGLLTRIAGPGYTHSYAYDNGGRVTTVTTTIEGRSFTTGYRWDRSGILTGMTYPDGRSLTFSQNSAGQYLAATLTENGNERTLADHLSYKPFGPLTGMVYGNGIPLTRTWDESYQLQSATEGNLRQVTYQRNRTGHITGITHIKDPSKSQAFSYDDLHRLTRAEGPYGTIAYTYDKAGNRLTRTHNEYVDTYAYIPGTNRMDEITGTHPAIYTHDSNGNAFSISGLNLSGPTYSAAHYLYDDSGLRLTKTKDGVTTFYLYDMDGNLIAEANGSGNLIRSYYYMAGMRLAAADRDGNLYYFHNNHLETPVQMTGASGNVVWAADYLPFGKANVTIEKIRNDFRFPGQTYDAETGYYYNWNRYYHPETGRYLTADPMGQAGGINVYAYVLNSPVNFVDPKGLFIDDTITPAALGALATLSAVTYQALKSLLDRLLSESSDESSEPCGDSSPEVNPNDIIGKTPEEIDKMAKDLGLIPKGSDPAQGKGSYVDPVTGEQRVLSHPHANPPHGHVNNPQGERLDVNGNVVPNESPEAHIPINIP